MYQSGPKQNNLPGGAWASDVDLSRKIIPGPLNRPPAAFLVAEAGLR